MADGSEENKMSILEKMDSFERKYGKTVVVNQKRWCYYRLGRGTPILWLTGGLRRAALGYSLMELLAQRYSVIAPDYPPTDNIDEFMTAFDHILDNEKFRRFILAGQSYGGLLAQAYLVHRLADVELLVLSSSGPADYGRLWLAADYFAILLARLLPERTVKNMLAGGLVKALPLPESEKEDWLATIDHLLKNELSRADVLSHFAVAADLIRKRNIIPAAFKGWRGRVIVLSAGNDPTQSPKDILHYQKLFGRTIEQVDLDGMGHAAMLFNPQDYLELLEKAIAG
jgi:pimeloyl-ACP methyl ester carboxylesterase